MYVFLLSLHSWTRWLVFGVLVLAIARAGIGLVRRRHFGKTDHVIRSLASGVSHVQLMIGLALYFRSPIVAYFRGHVEETIAIRDFFFFGVFHLTAMIAAVILITVGAAKAKRKDDDGQKHRVVLLYFSIALLLIFIAIPWPFSPFAQRPYARPI